MYAVRAFVPQPGSIQDGFPSQEKPPHGSIRSSVLIYLSFSKLVHEHELSAKVFHSFAKKGGIFFHNHLTETVDHFMYGFELELSQWVTSGSSQLLTSHLELHHNMVLLSPNPPTGMSQHGCLKAD